jgi:hypothetical protein
MGAGGFHGRVRDGIGCRPPAKATRSSSPSVFRADQGSGVLRAEACPGLDPESEDDFHAWWISSSIGRLGPVSFTRYRASTPGLST